jgi:hypothetical protein
MKPPENDKRNGRLSLNEALQRVRESDWPEMYRFWCGQKHARVPEDAVFVRRQVGEWMLDGKHVTARLQALGRKHTSILEQHLDAPRFQCTFPELANARALSYLSSYDLEAALTQLVRLGFLIENKSTNAQEYGTRAWTIPGELGELLIRHVRARERRAFDVFSLRGYLDKLYDDPARAARTPPSRQREMYKLYSNDTAAVARVERLAPELRAIVEKAILEFGGILTKSLYERMDTPVPWGGRRWGHVLEESLVGTVERLDLTHFGIQHNDETLLIFNEVALAWLRRVAVPGDPDQPHDEASLGVNLVSNITRFLGFLIDHHVRFTVRGEIFKTTEKRLQEELIPNPGRELSRNEVLEFIQAFTRHAHLIESTGERTFAFSAQGRAWENQELEHKLRSLLEHSMDERIPGAENFHQARMRRILVRLLKRVEPLVWYDLMYVPFLARNTYLCSLDELDVESHFGSRMVQGQYTPNEDPQRMAWNLVNWVRHRLYLLGIVDLGYDRSGRPVAMRLTRVGARLLGVSDGSPIQAARVGNLVVTPDFEVVLFPTGDDAELVHDLDRFCARGSQSGVLHFSISEKSVHRALVEGMYLRRILETLEMHSRTPVPQNVLFSIRSWAARAGLMHLGKDHVVTCDDPDLMKRFSHDPGVRPLIAETLGESRVRLRPGGTLKRLTSLLRDLGFLVELDEA